MGCDDLKARLSHRWPVSGRWCLLDLQLPAEMVGIADGDDSVEGSEIGELSAYAMFEVEGQGGSASPEGPVERVPLPVTLKGRVLEVIKAPKGSVSLTVSCSVSGKATAPVSAECRMLSPFRARWLMARRVCMSLLEWPKARRHEAGLSVLGALFDLQGSYRQVGRRRAFFPPPDYLHWIERVEALAPGERRRLNRRLVQPALAGLSLVVVVDSRGGWNREQLDITLNSVSQQWRAPNLVVVLASESGQQELVAGQSEGLLECVAGRAVIMDQAQCLDELGAAHWCLIVPPGVSLAPRALAWFLCELTNQDYAGWPELIYSDHDVLAASGERSAPRFKPDWSPELAMVSGYPGDALLARVDWLQEMAASDGALPDACGLLLRAVEHASTRVQHTVAVLWHDARPGSHSPVVPVDIDGERLAKHLQRTLPEGRLERDRRGFWRCRYPLPLISGRPLRVSILIPTRDMLHFLKPCVDSLLEKTTWPDYEVLILNNQSTCPDTLAYMADMARDKRVRVVDYDYPFNFSAINNFGAQQASGDVLCLLNNDTEVITGDWLDEMVSRLMQPGVGVVGARLYFSDGRVQHAGDVLGPGGCATHLHGILDADNPGYMNRAVLPQDLSAVTAACLVTRRDLFEQLGGLDETHLPVAFNDVDYCLRVREAGHRVIYTPYAELYHHESVSRGKDDDPVKAARAKRETDYMRKRWAEVIERDPFYNPNLNYNQPDFRLGQFRRVPLPW